MWKNGKSLQAQPSIGAGTVAGAAGTDIDAYTYLRGVWNDHLQPVHMRLRAAAIAIEYERPRLAVSAQVHHDDFASILDARIKNYERIQNGQPPLIEAKPVKENGGPVVEVKPPKPHVADRRFRRM